MRPFEIGALRIAPTVICTLNRILVLAQGHIFDRMHHGCSLPNFDVQSVSFVHRSRALHAQRGTSRRGAVFKKRGGLPL